MKNTQKFTNLFLTVSLGVLVGACSATSLISPQTPLEPQKQANVNALGQPKANQSSFQRFPDLPIPSESTMDTQRTIVFGSGESWYGQLVLNTRNDPGKMFDFYRQELSSYDWQEITSVRAPVSVLTYERQNRVLSIQISGGALSNTQITLTVSPRGSSLPQ